MDDIAGSLARLIGPLRRTLLRTTRTAGDLPNIPEAQIEVLRALAARGACSPGTLAQELGLARSTISNLVKTMTASGLVDRTLDDGDGRSTVLSVSPRARVLLARYDDASTALLTESLAALSAAEREALADAVPVLNRLRDVLESARE